MLGWVDALALGLGTLAYLILAAGLLRLMLPAVLGGLVVAGWGLLGVELALRKRAGSEAVSEAPATAESKWERPLTLLLVGYLVVLAVATLFGALGPVDGLDWDSLSYHLAAPRIFLREGRIPFIAYDSHTHFPFTMEMLYTLGLQFGGAGGAKLFHWAAGWLTALAVGAWTDRLEVAGRRVPGWAGPVAAAAFASMPIVLWEMGTAYVDLGTALFQFLALTLLVDAVQRDADGLRICARRAALAGILSGFALGTKMTALLQFGLLGLGLLFLLFRATWTARPAVFRALLAFGVLGVAAGSPWYLKSWLWVHNPVYPFFYSFFPQSYSWTKAAADAYATEQRSFGLGKGPLEFLKSLWNLAVHGRAFYINDRSLFGDRIGSLGPLWVGLLPLALWARGLGWRIGALLAYFGGSMALWFLLSQQSRYLTAVFAPLAVVVAVLPAVLPGKTLRIGSGAFIAGALALNLLMHGPVAQSAINTALASPEEVDQYLATSLPGLYESTKFVNQLPENSRIALYQETRGYYFDRPYFWANPLQHNLIPYDTLPDGTALVADLRRFGITHVLINHQFTTGVEASNWYRLLMDAIQTGSLVEVYRSTRAEAGRRGVIIYELR